MTGSDVTDGDRAKARICLQCPICRQARKMQKGVAYWFVKNLEGGICPSCQDYERAYVRKAHEPLPQSESH